MYYIINNNTDKLALFDDNKERFDKTLQFMPELQNERILETDIVTATELQAHPNKCIIGDVEITIVVPDYETQTREVENGYFMGKYKYDTVCRHRNHSMLFRMETSGVRVNPS